MEQKESEKMESAWGDRIRALKNVPPVLKILWESGPAVVAWGLVLRVFVALMPWAIARVAAWIMNGVEHALRHQGVPQYFWWVVGLEVSLAVLNGLLTRTIDFFDALLADRYTHHVSIEVMRKAAQLDLTTYEDPVYYDRLERARWQPPTDWCSSSSSAVFSSRSSPRSSLPGPFCTIRRGCFCCWRSVCCRRFWVKHTTPFLDMRRISVRPPSNA